MTAGRSKAKDLIGEGPPTLNHWERGGGPTPGCAGRSR
jgi:hypothetical protein